MNSDQIADILGQLAHTTREIWDDGPADGEELIRQKKPSANDMKRRST